jgi:hypothetical protein
MIGVLEDPSSAGVRTVLDNVIPPVKVRLPFVLIDG